MTETGRYDSQNTPQQQPLDFTAVVSGEIFLDAVSHRLGVLFVLPLVNK